jgi:hypothetical protein
MPPGNVITGGAVCDLWIITDDTIPEATPQQVKPTPWVVEVCVGCDKLYNNICIITGKNATKRCKDYAGIGNNETVRGSTSSGNSESVSDDFNTGRVTGTNVKEIADRFLDADFIDNIVEQIVEANMEEDKAACSICIESYYNNNIPWCRFKNEAVEADEWCARFIREK